MGWWDSLKVPTQDQFDDIEYVNPAEAFRRQADAINLSSPLYEELETVEAWLTRARSIEKELIRRILAQNMTGLKSVQTRTNDLVDAFVLDAATRYQVAGETKDISDSLLKLRRRIERYEGRKVRCERRLRAIQGMADRCEAILNWHKFAARLEVGRGL